MTRDYQKVEWHPQPSREVRPIDEKLLPGDTISLDGAVLRTSLLRREGGFVGVALFDRETLGRDSETGLICYKVVPFARGAPVHRLPMKLTGQAPRRPTYVRVAFRGWEEDSQRPTCRCLERIGVVDDLGAYATFRLQAAGLLFSKRAHRLLMQSVDPRQVLKAACSGRPEDPSAAIAVDPVGARDFDDAIGASATEQVLSIYIADVPAILDALPRGAAYVPDQTATIYLPGGTRPMLPRTIAEDIGSLVAGKERPAWRFMVTIDECGRVASFTRDRVVVRVTANYTYSNVRGGLWNRIAALAKLLNAGYGWYEEFEMEDSHNVVACCMLAVNHAAGVILKNSRSGLLRACNEKEGASYVKADAPGDVRHETLGLAAYAHVTSPLRRVADIVNLRCLAGEECGALLGAALRDQAVAIRRVESDVALLHMVQKDSYETLATVAARQGPDSDGMYDYDLVVSGCRVKLHMRSAALVSVGTERLIRMVRVHGEYEWGRQVCATWATTQTCSRPRM